MSANLPFPVSPAGDIADTPLPDILESLRHQRSTGTLTIERGNVVKRILISEGQIIFATSTEERDRLGEILVKYGKLTRMQLDEALRISEKKGGFRKFGAILVESGFLAPKELFNGLKLQVKDIIASLFLWTEGAYHFDGQIPPDTIHLHFEFENLIADIIQQIKQEG